MDHLSETKTPIKRRRHSAAFKAQILEEINQPGTSIAAVAQRHGVNANLIHKWRRTEIPNKEPLTALPSFVAIQPQLSSPSDPSGTILLELPVNATTVKIHWPVCHAAALAHWLKAMLA